MSGGPVGRKTGIDERASQALDRSSVADRASRPLSSTPRAFLRWAGSKRSLLRHVVPVLPAQFNNYWEPFLGSGSLFFTLQPARAFLSDMQPDLIATYLAVRDLSLIHI